MRKINFAFLATVLLGLSACSSVVGDDMMPEAALPADMPVVVAVDYSQNDQVGAFKELKERFPETELTDKLLSEIEAEFSMDEEKGEMSALAKEVFADDWKIVLGLSVEGLELGANFDEYLSSDQQVYFVGKFAQADKVEELIDLSMPEDCDDRTNCSREADGGKVYWTDEADDSYLVRYQDVFVLTNTAEARDQAVARLESGSGFNDNDDFAENIQDESYLGYVYVDAEGVGSVFDDLYAEWGAEFAASMEAFGDMYVFFTADDIGIRTMSKSLLKGEDPLATLGYLNPDYTLDLINRVPGEGVIFYVEQGSAETYLSAFITGFSSGYNSVAQGTGGELLVAETDGAKVVAEYFGVEEQEAQLFLNSPFAFAMHDVGNYYPTFSMFLDVGNSEEAQAVAQKVTSSLDQTLEDAIVLFDDFATAQLGEEKGLLKQSTEGDLHKVSLSWEDVSSTNSASLAFLPALTSQPLEFYYGLIDEETFVLAFYPNLTEVYGEDVLAENEIFEEAQGEVMDSGFTVSYGSIEPLFNIADKYVAIAQSFGVMTQEDLATYQEVARLFKTMKYMMGVNYMEGDVLMSESVLAVVELEKEED